MELYEPIVACLDAIGSIEADWDSKTSTAAYGLLKSITDHAFIVGRGGVEVCSVPCSRRVAGSNPRQEGYIWCLAAGGLRVRIYLKPPRRDPGQVLHSQLLMRFGVKLRFSVRAVVGSASE